MDCDSEILVLIIRWKRVSNRPFEISGSVIEIFIILPIYILDNIRIIFDAMIDACKMRITIDPRPRWLRGELWQLEL